MTANFDLLRAKVERETTRPSIVAITSSKAEDGRDVAAHGLAQSLASTGYATLLLEMSPERNGQPSVDGLPFDEIGRQQAAPNRGTGNVTLLRLPPSVRRTTNQPQMGAAFAAFRQKFDYVVLSAEYEAGGNPFATSAFALADAVLVSLRLGRRQTRSDVALSRDLERIGERFLGLVALDQATIETPTAKVAVANSGVRLPVIAHAEKELRRPEVAKWRT